MPTSDEEVLELLHAWNNGDQAALETLIPLVHPELQRLAHAYLSRNRPGHDLETTALINEMFIHLVERPQIEWQSRRHFFAIAAHIMRQILIDHARKEINRKGGAKQIPLAALANVPEKKNEQILLLDEALTRLEELDERKSQIVELKYFGGLTLGETAQVLGISTAMVQREWRFAKTWLHREMTGQATGNLYVPIITEKPKIDTQKPEMPAFVTGDSEKKMAEAWSNRELVATLMSGNWAGLKLFVQLRKSPKLTKQEVVSVLETDAGTVNSLLLKLEELGALKNQDGVLSLTNRGNELLQNFEMTIDNTFS